MASERTQRVGREFPEDPEDLLPADSVLSLDEYLALHAALGNPARYEICYRPFTAGAMSPAELAAAMAVDDSTFHYHLNELVDVGLIEKRQRTKHDHDDFYTYYRATVFGEVALSKSIDDLIRGEQAFEAMYDSSSG